MHLQYVSTFSSNHGQLKFEVLVTKLGVLIIGLK